MKDEARENQEARDMVEDREAHQDLDTATSLQNAASAGQSLIGYAAINGLADQDEVARLAYEYFRKRQQEGQEGSPEDDWYRAELELRSRLR